MSSNSISPPNFELQELDSTCGQRRLCSALESIGIVRIHVPGAAKIHMQSLDEAKNFFYSDSCDKAPAEGWQYFKSRYGDRTVLLPTLFGTADVSLADYLAGERGWVPRRASPSRADKEYFQWAALTGAKKASVSAMKTNIWPHDKKFIAAKRALLRMHRLVHVKVIAHLGVVPMVDHSKRNVPHEVICRDTRYFSGENSVSARVSGGAIRNPAHTDLSNGTLVSYASGFQIYIGPERARVKICEDEANWQEVDCQGVNDDYLLYMTGLATEIQTCGRLRATWHRVVRHRGDTNERFSTVSFFNAGVDDVLRGGVDIRHRRSRYPTVARVALPLVGSHGYWAAVH